MKNASSIAIVHCDMEMQSTLMALNSRGQGYSATQTKSHLG